MSPEIRKFIQDEVKKQVNIILSGQAGANTQFVETIDNLFPGMPSILNRPVLHPYGYVSRAPQGTLSVTARMGDHAGNRMVIGHRDANRPAVGPGESAIYNVNGYEVRLAAGTVQIGKNGTFETAVVGDTLVTLLSQLLDLLATHTHIGNLGAPTSPPQQASDFTQLKSDFVANERILAKDGGRF